MIFLTVPVMGLFVSLVSVFLGLGGGILLVPLLPAFFSLTIHESVATSLSTIVLVVGLNTWKFHQKKLVHWPIVAIMGPISALTAVLAALVSQWVDARVILIALVVILCLVAVKTFYSSINKKQYEVSSGLTKGQKMFSFFGGALAGLTSGFAGVGSGVILSPVMIFLKTVRPEQLVPTANANMLCTTLAGSFSFFATGHFVKWNQWGLIRWDLALGVFVFSSFFSHFLRPHQNKLPFRLKSLLLACLLFFLIVKIVIQLFA